MGEMEPGNVHWIQDTGFQTAALEVRTILRVYIYISIYYKQYVYMYACSIYSYSLIKWAQKNIFIKSLLNLYI